MAIWKFLWCKRKPIKTFDNIVTPPINLPNDNINDKIDSILTNIKSLEDRLKSPTELHNHIHYGVNKTLNLTSSPRPKRQKLECEVLDKLIFTNLELGYLYLLKEREFIKTKENIYKIGKSCDYRKRFAQYPNDSQIFFLYFSQYMSQQEQYFLKVFRSKFVNRKDIGREYFEGNHDEIVGTFLELCSSIEKSA